MGVGDAHPDAVEAAALERAQELAPERFGLDLTDVEADHFAPAGVLDGVGDHEPWRPRARPRGPSPASHRATDTGRRPPAAARGTPARAHPVARTDPTPGPWTS